MHLLEEYTLQASTLYKKFLRNLMSSSGQLKHAAQVSFAQYTCREKEAAGRQYPLARDPLYQFETAHAKEAGGRLGQSRNWEHSLGGSSIQSQQQVPKLAFFKAKHALFQT